MQSIAQAPSPLDTESTSTGASFLAAVPVALVGVAFSALAVAAVRLVRRSRPRRSLGGTVSQAAPTSYPGHSAAPGPRPRGDDPPRVANLAAADGVAGDLLEGVIDGHSDGVLPVANVAPGVDGDVPVNGLPVIECTLLQEEGTPPARGAFGIVMRGMFRGEEVAVKTFGPDASKEVVDNEIVSCGKLYLASHPNVMEVLGQCRDAAGKPALVFKLYSDGTLHALLCSSEVVSELVALRWALCPAVCCIMSVVTL